MKNFDAPLYLQISQRMNAGVRLVALRKLAEKSQADWRAAREYGFNNWAEAYTTLSQGYDDSDNGPAGPKKAIWYCHTGEQFRDERNADEISGAGVNHHGWYSDDDCSETFYGIVGRLTHGRFIAGYANTDTDERVYFGDVYTDEKDAARAADHEAQRVAEAEKEHDERHLAATKINNEIDDAKLDLRKNLALRNHPNFSDAARDEVRYLAQTIRDKRDELKNDYSDIQF